MTGTLAEGPGVQATRRAGRIVGFLILLQMFGSWISNFVLEAQLFARPGFLINAGPHASQIGLAVIVSLVTDALWMGIAVTAFPIFWQHTRRLALYLVALGAVILAISVVENAGILSMVSLSKAYTDGSPIDRLQFEATRVAVASARNWPHFLVRLFHGFANLVFYAGLYKVRLVPRVLSGFGLVASVVMIVAFAMVIFGHDIVFPLLAPMGLSQLILALWLMAKSFRADQPADAVCGPEIRSPDAPAIGWLNVF